MMLRRFATGMMLAMAALAAGAAAGPRLPARVPSARPVWVAAADDRVAARPASPVRQAGADASLNRARDLQAAVTPEAAAALRRGIEDLSASFGARYPRGKAFLQRLSGYEKRLADIRAGLAAGQDAAVKDAEGFLALQREAMLANPLLNFGKLLLVQRKAGGKLGLPQNWQGNCALPTTGYENEIDLLSPVGPQGELQTLFKPQGSEFVGDVDLNFEGDRLLFSMPGSQGRWQIWEIRADGSGLRQVTPGEEPDVDNYDACYLPNGRVLFDSTRCFQGVPCVGGANTVANLCVMDADGRNTRMLCFDQDHDWCPTVMNDGRVLYSRWEYSDTPHYFSRMLFRMNPDGTEQMEYYGSNSYWPNSLFYARPIPGDPTKVVAIVSGHHGAARMGEMVLLDPARGGFQSDGVIQRIPGRGKPVNPVIADQLVAQSWPKYLHPYPLSAKYFLVAAQPTPRSSWGIYLVDVFDNRTLLYEKPGYALFEPIPLRKIPRPPVIPERVKPGSREATVYLSDIYAGEGLKGVPRGTVRRLRVYEPYYCYPKMGGHKNIGVEGPWDVHRILGTVPVNEDGSAAFKVPANTPVAVQPLDEKGRAIQLMRSWFVGMPGEVVSCVGCHERQNTSTAPRATLAARRAPVAITPWYGPARGFSFKREVQPVLDRYCVTCHNATPRPDGQKMLDLAEKPKNGWGNFTPSYLALHPYVRRPGPESDYHLQAPYEFYAGTSELVQMLEKGHYGVRLDAEAWDRLTTWIDLNVPDHGTWGENKPIPADFHQRRMEMLAKYANRPEDPEAIPAAPATPLLADQRVNGLAGQRGKETAAQLAPLAARQAASVSCPNWPFGSEEARRLQAAAGPRARRTLDLGGGLSLEMVLVPAGEYVMGSREGFADERPEARVRIEKPFWMGVCEVSNAQYARFDPAHDSGYIDQQHKDHTTPGYPAHEPNQPVIRVSWEQAMAFCRWLSQRSGLRCTLPTEAQWEWACRAGADTPFSYGGPDTDFAPYANLADASLRLLAVSGVNPQPIKNPSPYEDFLPKDARFNDGEKIVCEVGRYQANAWGLKDMHGNVAEWTRSLFRPYPYTDADGRNEVAGQGPRVVRGGSWYDRPLRARASTRRAYLPWQPVFDVGFRVVMAAE